MSNEEKVYRYNSKSGKKSAYIYMPIIFAALLFCGVLLGISINRMGEGKGSPFVAMEDDKMDELVQFVIENYVDTISKGRLYETVFDQMLLQLDPHSRYIPSSQLGAVNEELEGNFKGVGIQFMLLEDTVYVLKTIEGGPAETAGLKAGDRIITVNDSVIAGTGITQDQVMGKLKGKEDTKVEVGIIRDGIEGVEIYSITRGSIPLFTARVAYMIDDEIGYIKIDNFNRNTHSEFAESLSSLKDQGMEKLILDLQGNPGGILTEAVEVVDELMERKRLVTYTEGQSSPRFDYNTQRYGLFEEGDVAVLIDQGSASASEIVAGALQDWDRATIIGRRSFGKGLVQRQIELTDGSAIRLTIARYYTPSGRSIQKPYEAGIFDYESEVYDRYENGEIYSMDSVKMEDSTEYKTMGGRIVYGGGGIFPDIYVPRDTIWRNDAFLSYASHARSFTDKYYARNSLDFAVLEDDEAFASSWNLPDSVAIRYQSYVEEREGPIRPLSDHERDVIESMIKSEIAKFIWGDNVYYRVLNRVNESVQTALDLLRKSQS